MIHKVIMDKVEAVLRKRMVTDISSADLAIPGAIVQGPLQGNPDPDVARISITINENDPDKITGGDLGSNSFEGFEDQVVEVECGGSITWVRYFTIKARCLLEGSRENLVVARQIASTVRSRIERTLLGIDFTGITSDNEYISRGILSNEMHGEMLQSGGPPDAYDFHIRVIFSVLTTMIL
jgi:hypothetical protein